MEGELWQMDMIHIQEGSRYDGYFERVAERISAVLTDEMRLAIPEIKNTKRLIRKRLWEWSIIKL